MTLKKLKKMFLCEVLLCFILFPAALSAGVHQPEFKHITSKFLARQQISVELPKTFHYSTVKDGSSEVLFGKDAKKGGYFAVLAIKKNHKNFEAMLDWLEGNPHLMPAFSQPLMHVVIQTKELYNTKGFSKISFHSGCNGSQAMVVVHAIRKDGAGSYVLAVRMPPEIMDKEEEYFEKIFMQIKAKSI